MRFDTDRGIKDNKPRILETICSRVLTIVGRTPISPPYQLTGQRDLLGYVRPAIGPGKGLVLVMQARAGSDLLRSDSRAAYAKACNDKLPNAGAHNDPSRSASCGARFIRSPQDAATFRYRVDRFTLN